MVPADEVLTDVLAGELRALAVLGDERCADLPNVPTAAEVGEAVTVPVFGGVAAPAGTPPEVVQELGWAFSATASSPKFGRALVGTGRSPMARRPGEFSDYVDIWDEWAAVAVTCSERVLDGSENVASSEAHESGHDQGRGDQG